MICTSIWISVSSLPVFVTNWCSPCCSYLLLCLESGVSDYTDWLVLGSKRRLSGTYNNNATVTFHMSSCNTGVAINDAPILYLFSIRREPLWWDVHCLHESVKYHEGPFNGLEMHSKALTLLYTSLVFGCSCGDLLDHLQFWWRFWQMEQLIFLHTLQYCVQNVLDIMGITWCNKSRRRSSKRTNFPIISTPVVCGMLRHGSCDLKIRKALQIMQKPPR